MNRSALAAAVTTWVVAPALFLGSGSTVSAQSPTLRPGQRGLKQPAAPLRPPAPGAPSQPGLGSDGLLAPFGGLDTRTATSSGTPFASLSGQGLPSIAGTPYGGVNPYAAGLYGANPYAVSPYPGVSPYGGLYPYGAYNPYGGINPYGAVNPYGAFPPYGVSPYGVSPYGAVNPYGTFPYGSYNPAFGTFAPPLGFNPFGGLNPILGAFPPVNAVNPAAPAVNPPLGGL
jgi:hypothetical protein